jgi:hypothetical protein
MVSRKSCLFSSMHRFNASIKYFRISKMSRTYREVKELPLRSMKLISYDIAADFLAI